MDVSHILCDVEEDQESDLLPSLSNGERREGSEPEDEGDQMGHIIDVAQGSKELALSFAAMSESVRANTVRSMLLVVTAPADKGNHLGKWNTNYAQNRKRKRRSVESSARITTEYALK
eukprot:IDg22192t1